MANDCVNMERFAHDVCVHVLEKFGVFKAPDDMRKQNKYLTLDFLPRISRSVVSFAIWLRSDFKRMLEDRHDNGELDNEIKWIFDDFLVSNHKFSESHWTERMCISLALCTEYTQFANSKGLKVSLNKLAIAWNKYFEKRLKSDFDENGGFPRLYNYFLISQMDQQDNFQALVISEYCRSYGTIECAEELARKCIAKHGFNISLEQPIFGIKKMDYFPGDFHQKADQPSPAGKEEEVSQNLDCEASEYETLPNDLLGIRPHEEILREIDPFFVENIPIPPKAGESLKKSEASEDFHSSWTLDSEPDSDDSSSSSNPPENEVGTTETIGLSSKSLERESLANAAVGSTSKLDGQESGSNEAPRSQTILPEQESGSKEAPRSRSKLHEQESGSNEAPRSPSELHEQESGSKEAPSSPLKLHEQESGSNEAPKSPSKLSGKESTPSEASKLPGRESSSKETPGSTSKFSGKESALSESPRLSERDSVSDQVQGSPLESTERASDTSGDTRSPIESSSTDGSPLELPKREFCSGTDKDNRWRLRLPDVKFDTSDCSDSTTSSSDGESGESDGSRSTLRNEEWVERVDRILNNIVREVDMVRALIRGRNLVPRTFSYTSGEGPVIKKANVRKI